MKLQSTIFIFLILVFIGCKSKSAFDYSQAIVKIERDFAAEIVKADEKVTRYMDAEQNDSAAIVTQQMEDLAENKLEEVRKLKAPDVAEGENFKQAAIHYFTYLKTIYNSFNRFTKATNDEERETERQRLAKIIADKDDATKAMQDAQKKFAEANSFRIEKD